MTAAGANSPGMPDEDTSMPKTKPATVTARVLADSVIDGVAYRIDQVVELAADVAALNTDALDPHADAVAYALSQGASVIVHVPPTAQE